MKSLPRTFLLMLGYNQTYLKTGIEELPRLQQQKAQKEDGHNISCTSTLKT